MKDHKLGGLNNRNSSLILCEAECEAKVGGPMLLSEGSRTVRPPSLAFLALW